MNRKFLSIVTIFIFLFVFFSGCIFDNVFNLGTTFFLESWEITDDEGFPSIHINFKSNRRINLRTYDSNSKNIDSEFFFGNDNATIAIGSYRQVLSSEKIKLKAFDENNVSVFEKTFSFTGSNLYIISCNPYIWENQDETSLIGIKLNIGNNGDTPVYPGISKISYHGNTYSSYILPCTVLPESTANTSLFVYIQDIHEGDSYDITLEEIDGNVLTSESMSFSNMNTLQTTRYNKGLENTLSIPLIDFLYNYYDNHNLYVEDYTAFVLDRYDDQFISFLVDEIISSLDFGGYRYKSMTDAEKIDYLAGFAQNLDYREDVCGGIETEDPQYPADTVFNHQGRGGGDCEDKAILIASLLYDQNYNVSLIRIPNHMAVGVNLSKDSLPNKEFYINGYYFLDTSNTDLGFIHQDYRNPDEVEIQKVGDKPIIYHTWRNNASTIYLHSDKQKTLKVIVYIENLGDTEAENLELRGVFYIKDNGLVIKDESFSIPTIKPYGKIKTMISMDIPKKFRCKFDTRIYLDGEKVSTQSSKEEFNK